MNNPQIESKIDEIESRVRAEAKIIRNHDYHWSLHVECVKHVELQGIWLEFGVYRGRTICNFAKLTPNTIYGFDAFQGLPEDWDKDNPKGVYSLGGQVPVGGIDGGNDENPGMYSTAPSTKTKPWPPNVKLVPGWFDDTLPKFAMLHQEDVAFLHIDSDVYTSCCTVLNVLKEQIKRGTVILFDELLDYDTYREHEIKSFAEFLIETGLNFKPLVYQDLGHSQVCIKILDRTH